MANGTMPLDADTIRRRASVMATSVSASDSIITTCANVVRSLFSPRRCGGCFPAPTAVRILPRCAHGQALHRGKRTAPFQWPRQRLKNSIPSFHDSFRTDSSPHPSSPSVISILLFYLANVQKVWRCDFALRQGVLSRQGDKPWRMRLFPSSFILRSRLCSYGDDRNGVYR